MNPIKYYWNNDDLWSLVCASMFACLCVGLLALIAIIPNRRLTDEEHESLMPMIDTIKESGVEQDILLTETYVDNASRRGGFTLTDYQNIEKMAHSSSEKKKQLEFVNQVKENLKK